MDQSGGPQRPSGEVPTIIGWLLIAVGVAAAFMSAGARTLDGALLGYLIAQLGIGVGVLLVALGYIVRALWFLPGREVPTIAEPNQASAGIACDWCGQVVAGGNLPCSQAAREKLAAAAPRIKNSRCREALAQQGFDIGEQQPHG